jgi:hypothetical protein
MTRKLLMVAALTLSAGLTLTDAQQGLGKPFGARDPRTCPSRKDGLSVAQAKQYVICDYEKVLQPNTSTALLYLATDVTVQVGKGRPFNMRADSFGFATTNGIDPSETVYPIQGSFTGWYCSPLHLASDTGKNCSKVPQPAAKGICFKSSFSEWHCIMTDYAQSAVQCAENCPGYAGVQPFPPPTGQ